MRVGVAVLVEKRYRCDSAAHATTRGPSSRTEVASRKNLGSEYHPTIQQRGNAQTMQLAANSARTVPSRARP